MSRHPLQFAVVMLAALLCVTGSGCGQSGSHKLPKPGIFKGAYFGCSETIILNSDGSFLQTLVFPGSSFTNSGSWSFETRGTGLAKQDKVVFSRFLVAVDTSVDPPAGLNPPKEYNFYDGDWIPDRDRIEFRAEARYFVQRVLK
jgi:hypothetical protein